MDSTGLFRISLLLGGWLALTALLLPAAGRADGSGFGAISIPEPATPAQADKCVEPTEIMRREHMHFLYQQRDRTVLDGERDGKYSLVGCMDCHNPVSAAGEAPHYGDADHFCSVCHAYASVSIDCFECHADRGYGTQQSEVSDKAWDDAGKLTAATLQRSLETGNGD